MAPRVTVVLAQGSAGAWLGLVAVVAAFVGWIYVLAHQEKKRVAAWKSVGSQLGLHFAKGDPLDLRSSGFSLFDVGHSRKVSVTLQAPDAAPYSNQLRIVFSYIYVTGGGKNQQAHPFTGVLIPFPAMVPPLSIGREHFGGWLSAFGFRDVELESASFNKRFRITAEVDRVAFSVLDGAMQEWLLQHASGSWSQIECRGTAVLVTRPGVKADGIEELLTFATEFRDRVPEVTRSMFPPPTPGES